MVRRSTEGWLEVRHAQCLIAHVCAAIAMMSVALLLAPATSSATVVRNCPVVMIPGTIAFHEVRARNTPCREADSQIRRLFGHRRPAPGWHCSYHGVASPVHCYASRGRRIDTSGGMDAI